MVAVNEEFVMNEEMIKAGDIVALIPPVSGGITFHQMKCQENVVYKLE